MSGTVQEQAVLLLCLLSFSLMSVCRTAQYHLLRTLLRKYSKTKSQASLAKGSEEEATLLLAETKGWIRYAMVTRFEVGGSDLPFVTLTYGHQLLGWLKFAVVKLCKVGYELKGGSTP